MFKPTEPIKSHFKRSISTLHISIPPTHCPFAEKCKSNGNPRSYKTVWSLLHHICSNHKQEADFKNEFERIRRMVK